jgi:histidine triad (HIT) family protein
VFCQIANREIAAHVVHEDERLMAFLDRGPIRAGHTQIVPKAHFPYFDETPAELVCAIAALGQQLALALKRLYRVPRVAFLFTGSDIAHTHAHIVPLYESTDITSRRYIAEEKITFRSIPRASDLGLASSAEALKKALLEVSR